VVTITVSGQDHDFLVTDRTQIRGVPGGDLSEQIKQLEIGKEVQFLAVARDDQQVLVGLRAAPVGRCPGTRVSPDTSKLKPLGEMGDEKYQGFSGGLYPEGRNTRPESHEAGGRRLAQQVQPLDPEGQPDPGGKIVLLSIGMSNTSQASQGFARWLNEEDQRSPRLVFVNGAQGGMTAAAIQDAEDGRRGTTYWTTVDQRLEQAGVTRERVQAVWIKQADARDRSAKTFPAKRRRTRSVDRSHHDLACHVGQPHDFLLCVEIRPRLTVDLRNLH
jgi:hypothetical protein